MHIPWETSCTLWPVRHTWGKSTRSPKILRQTLYCSPMAPKKLNKHTLETYYSEWDITMAGSITAGITLKIYSLLKDKENNKTKFSLIRHINKLFQHILRLMSSIKLILVISMWFRKSTICVLKMINDEHKPFLYLSEAPHMLSCHWHYLGVTILQRRLPGRQMWKLGTWNKESQNITAKVS